MESPTFESWQDMDSVLQPVTTFDCWTHANLASFAKDATAEMLQQQRTIAQLRLDNQNSLLYIQHLLAHVNKKDQPSETDPNLPRL